MNKIILIVCVLVFSVCFTGCSRNGTNSDISTNTHDNVCPNTGCRETTKEAKKLMGYISDHYDSLQSTLTSEQKEILEKFEDCHAELTDINEREIFVYAFRLGARVAIEMLSLDI